MKWTLILLALGVARGIIFPDYRSELNIIIILFVTPIVISVLAFYWTAKYSQSKVLFFVVGLLAVYLSELIGVAVYGLSAGWHYVTDDLETHAVIYMTLAVQTVVYFVASGVTVFYQRS